MKFSQTHRQTVPKKNNNDNGYRVNSTQTYHFITKIAENNSSQIKQNPARFFAVQGQELCQSDYP